MPTKRMKIWNPDDVPVTLLLVHATKLWHQKLKKLLAGHSLTLPRLGVLMTLQYGSAPASQRTIAELMGSDAMTTSQVVKALENEKLLTRVKDENDSRAYRVQITAKGSRLMERLVPLLEQAKGEFATPLGDKEQLLAALLTKLIAYHSKKK